MSSFFREFFSRYLRFASGHRLLCISLSVLLFVAAVWATTGLKLKSSLKELLPENSPSVVQLDRMLDRVGGISVLTVAISSPNVGANMKFVDDLNIKLAELPKSRVRYVVANVAEIRKFYEDNMLHYINLPDLEKLYGRVSRVVEYEKFKRTPFYIDLGIEEPPVTLKWRDIEDDNKGNVRMPLATYKDYYGGEEGRFLIMMIRPQGAALSIDKARTLIADVQGMVDSLNPSSYDPTMEVGLCGNVVSTVEEYDTLRTDMFSTFGLCILLVALAITLYFLRMRIVAFLGMTLLFGIAFTFALTRYTIGYLNAQTAFLASIIVGTGINYGVILMGRYLEERKNGLDALAAMETSLTQMAMPTFLAAATTALSFAVLMVARVRGLSQFGFIGSVGVMFCWLSTMFFLPLMVVVSEHVKSLFKGAFKPKRKSALIPAVDRMLQHFPIGIIAISLVLTVIASVVVYRFIPNSIEYDFSKMRNKSSAVDGTEALEKRVSKLWVGSMTPAVVLLDTPADGPSVCDAVMKQNDSRPRPEQMVDNCFNVYDMLPKDQDKKLPILKRFNRLLDQKWIGDVKGDVGKKLRTVKRSLKKYKLEVDDLPDDLVRNFTDLAGGVGTFAFINPRSGMPLSNGHNLIRFADTIQNITTPDGRVFHATGQSLIFSDIVKIVKEETPLLTLVSLIAVLVLVLIFIRKMSEGYVIAVALIWTVLMMLGAMGLWGIKINFFNFIALPLTFGVGVDYALNVTVRFHMDRKSHVVDILRHTGGAVALCATTTIIGYFVLTRSTNQAVAQFGTIAIIGEFASIFAAVVLVPAIIIAVRRKKKSDQQLSDGGENNSETND
jgi:uncharacterized protein